MQPKLIIIGGPNGSGKTTFANELLESEHLVYLGADAIAYELDPRNPSEQAFKAGRLFSQKLSEYIENGTSLIIESTLSGLSLKKYIERARSLGYQLDLVYLFLETAELCIDRIEERVAKGGHFVPPIDVRRRFYRSYSNFEIYRKMVSTWALYYNLYREYEPVAFGEGERVEVVSFDLMKKFQAIKEQL